MQNDYFSTLTTAKIQSFLPSTAKIQFPFSNSLIIHTVLTQPEHLIPVMWMLLRNSMNNELKTTACLEIISNTDAKFPNLHIDKARKTHDDKPLYLITLFTKQTLNLNCLLLTLKCNCSLFKFKFSLNNGHLIFWFAFNLAVHF